MPSATAVAACPPLVPSALSVSGPLSRWAVTERRYPPWCVKRPALVSRLADADDAALALIVAPAGYGKSTLLWEWSERDDRPFAWAFRNGEFDAGALPRRRHDRGYDDRGYVVVIDDAHLMAPAVLTDLVDELARELPRRSLIALASRTDPPFSTARLRARRALVEVRAGDLAMSCGEAEALLAGAGLELDPQALRAINRRTEGWPIGLYLAALALGEPSEAERPSDGATDISGDHHYLTGYFRDEVLPATPPHLLEFMVNSSVLDELSGPLCDAVLERHGSGVTLAELARVNLFLRPIDAAHACYRWHGLLRESLESELRRIDPDLAAELHLRASSWLYEHGEVDRAIDHAAAAGDEQRVAELLWPNVARYVTCGRGGQVQRWLRSFPEQRIADCTPLALAAAHAALASGDALGASRWRWAVAACVDDDAQKPGDASWRASAALIDAMSAGTGVSSMREAAARSYELEPSGSPWRLLACLVQGFALHLSGDRKGAIRLLQAGASRAAGTAPTVKSLCLAESAVIALEQRDYDLAAELTDAAVATLGEHGLVDQPALALVYGAAAASRARQGRSDEAKRDLRRGLDLLADLRDFVPWYGAETRILLAHASLWLADVVGARTLLAEASRLARRTPEAVMFRPWFDQAWEHLDSLAETSMAGPSALTIAELRILRFLPSHRSFREIAAQLGVSGNTVKTQAHAVYRKLGAASRSEAVDRAGEMGLLGQ